jgi:hypothetical protein
MAVAIGLAGSAAVVAAPVLPSVANFSAATATPVAGTKIGGAGRAGVKRSHDSSNIAPLFIGLGVLAAAASPPRPRVVVTRTTIPPSARKLGAFR